MADNAMKERVASCACGKVRIGARGAPIVSAVCYCADCQAGGRQLEAAGAHDGFRDAWGGTGYLTYRDDRVAVLDGAALLQGFKLSETAPTTRHLATCCRSAMYLKHGPGWWTSLYQARFGEDAPPLEMRNQTQHAASGAALPNDVPAYRSFPAALFGRLLRARLAMWWARTR
jgi:hypothetical protein